MADQPRRQQQQQQQQQQQEQRQEVRKTLTNDAERTKSPIPKSRGKLRAFKERATEKKPPPGGFDDTPVPIARPGLTVRITFHCARNLPTADINSLSSDPFIVAQLNTSLPTRHKEDPPLVFRTPTIHRTQNPEWNAQWVVANVPTSGFQMKIRIYDEDPADHDDRLGNAHLVVGTISANRPGLRLHDLKIEKRMESKRAWIVTGCLALAKFQIHLDMRLTVSVEVLGATEGQGGKVYTIGPQYWSTHFSPMIGRLTGTKVPGEKGKAQRYNFEANEIQLRGPVPDPLYHRYVEFKPFIKGTFTKAGLRGRIINHTLHHQHNRVYNYDRSTVHGLFAEPCMDLTLHFLRMAHYDQGSRLFTYVVCLDGLFRFTETGKEFGIDMLSKHSMHSDVSAYVAFSGEFFIRRIRPGHQSHTGSSSQITHASSSQHERSSHSQSTEDGPPHDPACYELFIDNDSGTYRPNAKYLGVFHDFLAANLPGLKIKTKACDDEGYVQLKKEQRERKKREGDGRTFTQINSSSSSFSSLDEHDLDHRLHVSHTIDGAADGRSGKAGAGAGAGRFEKGRKLMANPKSFVKDWATS